MAFGSEDHIRVRAYHLWEANGRPDGRDLEFWEQARETIFDDGSPAKKRSTAASAVAKDAKRGRRPARKRSERG